MTGDWSFARRPFWLLSHLFAVSVVVLFVILGFWQLSRLDQRRAANAVIVARTDAPTLELTAPPSGPDLEFRTFRAEVTYLESDLARVVNRSQGEVAGEWVVAVVEMADGSPIAVNRGFVPVNADITLDPVPSGPVVLSGWLRNSVETEGWFAVEDSGEGELMPRFDTQAVADRWGERLPTVFLQIAPDLSVATASFPDPVPLPPLGEGPHLGYAAQWFIFSILGVGFYLALLRRVSQRDDSPDGISHNSDDGIGDGDDRALEPVGD